MEISQDSHFSMIGWRALLFLRKLSMPLIAKIPRKPPHPLKALKVSSVLCVTFHKAVIILEFTGSHIHITHLYCMQKPAWFVPQTEWEYQLVGVHVKKRLVGTH